MKTFYFTAECKRDFDEFYKEWLTYLRKRGGKKIMRNWMMITANDSILTTSDVDCVIETDATKEEVIELMDLVDDGHKMISSIEEIGEYPWMNHLIVRYFIDLKTIKFK